MREGPAIRRGGYANCLRARCATIAERSQRKLHLAGAADVVTAACTHVHDETCGTWYPLRNAAGYYHVTWYAAHGVAATLPELTASINDTSGHAFGDKVPMTDVASEEAVRRKHERFAWQSATSKFRDISTKQLRLASAFRFLGAAGPLTPCSPRRTPPFTVPRVMEKTQCYIWREAEKDEPDQFGLTNFDKQ